MDHFFNLFHGGKLPGHFYGAIHHQGRGHHHSVAADCFDILDLYDFRLDTQLFYGFLSSLLELIAFRSTHSQDFDLFHVLPLSIDVNGVHKICLSP